MLIQDYETVLEKVLEGLRIYAVHTPATPARPLNLQLTCRV